jgi:hypothetical protein
MTSPSLNVERATPQSAAASAGPNSNITTAAVMPVLRVIMGHVSHGRVSPA